MMGTEEGARDRTAVVAVDEDMAEDEAIMEQPEEDADAGENRLLHLAHHCTSLPMCWVHSQGPTQPQKRVTETWTLMTLEMKLSKNRTGTSLNRCMSSWS